MPALNRLTARTAATPGAGSYCDGGGLWLRKRADGGAQWVLRVMAHGRRREMGLGSYPAVSLAEARRKAEDARALTRQGKDPIKARDLARREAARNLHALKDVAADAFEARKAELKGGGIAGRWLSPLERHILPKLGRIPVAELTQTDIRDPLAPIWHTKAETARKALNRLSICLQHAAALGLEVDLQATDKARALLGKSRHKPTNVPAMPWREVPAFYASLSDGTVTHLALRLLILTGVRSHPLRFLRLEQIDGDVWTIPGEAMKGRRDSTPDFRVPLSDEALGVIEAARPHARDGFLFPSVRKGVISDATMARLMERRGMDYRPHGFRSSLRDWLAEEAEARTRSRRPALRTSPAALCLAPIGGPTIWNSAVISSGGGLASSQIPPSSNRTDLLTNWKKYVAARDWDRLTHTMWSLDLDERTALLAELKSIVPMTYDENGVEREDRHVSAAEARMKYPELAGAASILEDGELEAAVLSDVEIWDGVRSNARALLDELLAAEEVTSRSPELSRRGHARKALHHLKQIEIWSVDRLETQASDEDRPIWEEIISLVAWNGVMAGSYAQRALGKRFEVDAVRGQKVAGGRRNGAHQTNARHVPLRERRFAAMAELVPELGPNKAARECERRGLGDWGNIKKQWNRAKESEKNVGTPRDT